MSADFLDALADQVAVAIERISLARGLAEARVLAETERMRAALLTSISHDLRTPLASILGTVSSLRSYADKYDANDRDELLATLESEAERLNRFVGNLLDMTRLESGAIELKLDLVDVAEIVGAALERAGNVLVRHRIEVSIDPDLPMLRLDPILLEQVLFNLLDNAAKYAPEGSRIDLRARQDGDIVAIEVIDEGPGIPPATSNGCSTSSTASMPRIAVAPGRVSDWRFAEGSLRRKEAASRQRTGGDRSGAVLTVRIPVAGSDRNPGAGRSRWLTPIPCSSLMTSRRSCGFCARAFGLRAIRS